MLIKNLFLYKDLFSFKDIDESEWDNELENVSAEELEEQINQMLAGNTH